MSLGFPVLEPEAVDVLVLGIDASFVHEGVESLQQDPLAVIRHEAER